MQDCEHKKMKSATIKREFLSHSFEVKGTVCEDCGAELWDSEIEATYKKWVDGISQKPKLQFKVSDDASRCLNKILERFPSASQATLVRSMIMVYTLLLSKGSDVTDMLNRAFESQYFTKFEEKQDILLGVEVRSSFFHDIASWATLFDMKTNEFASDAFHVILSLCISEDQDLQDFWNKEILPQIETFLKIA